MRSEVILGCRANVTVDRVLLVMITKPRDSREDATSHWKPQKARDRPGTTGIHHPEIENFAIPGNVKINTVSGIYVKVNESITTANLAMSSAKEHVGSGQVLQAVNQSTNPNNVGRVKEKEGLLV